MWEQLTDKFNRLVRSPSRALLVWLVAFLSGVGAHALYEVPVGGAGLVFVLAIGALFFSLTARFNKRAVFVLFCVVLATGGFWHYDRAWSASAYVLPPVAIESEEFTGVVAGYVREREKNTALTVQTEYGLARLYATTPHTYLYGDRLAWSCRPKPVLSAGDGWHDRLLLDGVRWTCNVYDEPEILARQQGDVVYRFVYTLKRGVVSSVQRVFPEPEASFLLGLLIGVKDGLPKELTESFRETGTTHILAVSGYNVSQLINVGVLLLALLLVPRRKSATVMAVGVIIFACVVGGDASVIRAAIMGCVGILATLYQRRYSGVRALLAAAALMLVVNPLVLKHDVGFQLSFAAVWGLHALAPGLLKLFPAHSRNPVIRILTETGAATLATMPIILYAFGRVPAVGLLANLLILPLIPWAMLFGALAAVIGLVSWSASLVPALAAAWIMRAVEWVAISLAEHVPLALEASVGPTVVVLLYGWLVLLSLALGRYRTVWRGT